MQLCHGEIIFEACEWVGGCSADRARWRQMQVWDVFEILCIEGPERGVSENRRGRDRKIDFVRAPSPHLAVESRTERGFTRTERNSGCGRKQRFLGGELGWHTGAAKPFVQNQ